MQYGLCTWKKYLVMQRASEHHMRIRDKRRVFTIMRSDSITADHLLPQIGMTMGEFAFWQLIGENRRKSF